MKNFKALLFSAFAIMMLASCEDDTGEYEPLPPIKKNEIQDNTGDESEDEENPVTFKYYTKNLFVA